MNPPTVLLTGFEPFDGEALNPSGLVVDALDGQRIGGSLVQGLVLPCAFADSVPALDRALRRWRPALVLALGQAARPAIGVERVAVNLCDARIADNAGARPIDVAVVAGGPAAYFATLPVKAMAEAVRALGLPAEVSHSAGTFVCNQVFYALMHRLRRRRGVRGGFVHLPLLPEQAARRAGATGLALDAMVGAVRATLAAALATGDDHRRSEGTLD